MAALKECRMDKTTVALMDMKKAVVRVVSMVDKRDMT